MNRSNQIATPKPQPLSTPASIAKGGTGAANVFDAAVNLGGINLGQLGAAGGVAAGDASGQLQATNLPAPAQTGATLSGSKVLSLGQVVNFLITNFDSLTTYNVSATGGTVAVSSDTITFTAGGVTGNFNITINGKDYPIIVGAARPAAPTVTATASGTTTTAVLNFNSSAFAMLAGSGTQRSTDWEVYADAALTQLVTSSLDDQVNLTSWSVFNMALNTTYYVRARYRAASLEVSDWSATASILTQAFYFTGTEEAKMVASDAIASAEFGYSIASSSDGSRVVIGARAIASNTGAIYIFVRTGNTWTQEQKITASDAATGFYFGQIVSMSADGTRCISGSAQATGGSTGAITQAGAVYIYLRTGTTWALEQRITPADANTTNWQFGAALMMSGGGNVIAVGASGANSTVGAVYIYVRTGTTWTQDAKYLGTENSGKAFANSVSITLDGTRVAVGCGLANVNATSNAGSVHILVRTSGALALEQRIVSPFPGGSSYFGISTALSNGGDRILVGEYLNSTGNSYIFVRNGSAWSLEQTVTPPDWASGNNSGWRVSMSGDGVFAAIGSHLSTISGSATAGAVNVWQRNGTSWSLLKKIIASDKAATNRFGFSSAFSNDGTRLLIGANGAAAGATSNTGAVYSER